MVEQGGVIKVLLPGKTRRRSSSTSPRGCSPAASKGCSASPSTRSSRRTAASSSTTRAAARHGATSDRRVPGYRGRTRRRRPHRAVLLVIPQPFANHNGGMVEFGPTGSSTSGWATADRATIPATAPRTNLLLGKILRIDVDHSNGAVPYSSPPDNPFVGPTPGRTRSMPTAPQPVALLLRPRDRPALRGRRRPGERVEEVDIVKLRGNYGWRTRKGGVTGRSAALRKPPALPFRSPVPHTNGRCSVTGGYVIRTSATLPQAPMCTATTAPARSSSSWAGRRRLLDTGLDISSFGEDEAGEIYVVGWAAPYRITSEVVCTFSVSPTSRSVPASAGVPGRHRGGDRAGRLQLDGGRQCQLDQHHVGPDRQRQRRRRLRRGPQPRGAPPIGRERSPSRAGRSP